MAWMVDASECVCNNQPRMKVETVKKIAQTVLKYASEVADATFRPLPSFLLLPVVLNVLLMHLTYHSFPSEDCLPFYLFCHLRPFEDCLPSSLIHLSCRLAFYLMHLPSHLTLNIL